MEGNVTKKPEANATIKEWFSGEFQKKYEEWYNENFGLSTTYVRANNQILYSLFHKSKAVGIVVGSGGHLFYENYLLSYSGQNYTGEEGIDVLKYRLEKLQDTLQKQGITLVTVLAPGPASFYPQDIPDPYGIKSNNTIYKSLSAKLNKSSINFIDFNAWFMRMKDTSRFVLMPKVGTHWSRYGAVLGTDSLLKYIRSKAQLDLPQLQITSIALRDSLEPPDDDIYKVANILFSHSSEKMAYPTFSYNETASSNKFSLMIVGDSYSDMLYRYSRLTPTCFSKVDFYPYYLEVYHSDGKPDSPVEDIDIGEEMKKNKVILLMATEANYGSFFWGFVDEAYKFFYKPNLSAEARHMRKYKASIMKDLRRLMNTQKDALKRNISFETTLEESAKSLMEDAEAGTINEFLKKKFCGRQVVIESAYDNSFSFTVSENLSVHLNRSSLENAACFEVQCLSEDKIGLLINKKFICTELGENARLVANRDNIGAWETFSVINLGGDTVAFKASNNKYVSGDPTNTNLQANKDEVGKWEKFILKYGKNAIQ